MTKRGDVFLSNLSSLPAGITMTIIVGAWVGEWRGKEENGNEIVIGAPSCVLPHSEKSAWAVWGDTDHELFMPVAEWNHSHGSFFRGEGAREKSTLVFVAFIFFGG